MTSAREAELLAQLQACDDRLEHLERLETENALLRQKIDLLVRQLFGAKSERLDPAQLLLLLQGGDAPPKAPEPVAAEEPRRSMVPSPPRERRPRLPQHLPVIEEVLDPAPVQACPAAWRCIGEEISEQLEYEPARFLRRRLIRRKYVRRGDADAVPIIAPLPARLQERCLAAPGLLAQILVACAPWRTRPDGRSVSSNHIWKVHRCPAFKVRSAGGPSSKSSLKWLRGSTRCRRPSSRISQATRRREEQSPQSRQSAR